MMPRACGDGELGCALVSLDSVGICASASDDSACGVNASISSGGPSSGVGRLKSVQQICGAQGDVAGGGQLNSGRNTIEALADLNNGAVVVLGEREVRLHPSDPNVESLEWTISRAARQVPQYQIHRVGRPEDPGGRPHEGSGQAFVRQGLRSGRVSR
jgi:hypothetical protein